MDAQVPDLPTLRAVPLWAIPRREDLELWRAYFNTFTTPDGELVLQDLYNATALTQGEDVRHLGRLDVFQGIIHNMQSWQRAQREGSHGTPS